MVRQPEAFTIPGAVDLHDHFRWPSSNKAENFETGTLAAIWGGYVFCNDMPNNPGMPTITWRRVRIKQRGIMDQTHIPVGLYAGAQPETEDRPSNTGGIEKMSHDCIAMKIYLGKTTGHEELRDISIRDYEAIIKEWHRVAPLKPIMIHRGDADLEEIIRVIADENNHHVHICHVNDPEEVEIIKKYKNMGLEVTCGICPHHLFMTSHDRFTQGAFAEMQPPLAQQANTEKLWDYFVRGEIDVLETDHAPHSKEAKWLAEKENSTCYGVPGIEFALPLLFYQMKKGRIEEKRIIEATSDKPAFILGIRITPHTKVTWSMEEYRIEDEKTQVTSNAKWTPYLGMLAVGKPKEVIILGKTIVRDGEIVDRYPRVVVNRDEII